MCKNHSFRDLFQHTGAFLIRQGGTAMIKHHITKYTENGKQKAVSWLQVNVFGKAFCLWIKEIAI